MVFFFYIFLSNLKSSQLVSKQPRKNVVVSKLPFSYINSGLWLVLDFSWMS